MMHRCQPSPPTPWQHRSRRPTTTRTTSGRSAPTSSRGRCSPRTASASSPCRSAGRSAGSHPPRRGVVPLAPFVPSRSLRRAFARYELRVDTAFAAVVAGLRATRRARELDRRGRHRRVRPPARARLGALGRGLGRRGAGRRALRRRARRALRRRVDVPRAHGRLEGGVRRPRRAAPRRGRRRPAAPRRPVADAAPRVAGRRRGHSRASIAGALAKPCRWSRPSRRLLCQESRPMSFDRPMKKSSRTIPSPTTETRS